MPIPAPRWKDSELDRRRLESIEAFKRSRIEEPLEKYLEEFDNYRSLFEEILEQTVDLSLLDTLAQDLLVDPGTFEALRYLAAPPVSLDDLKVLSETSVSRSAIQSDPAVAKRILDTIRLGLDRRRFPWVSDDREPTEAEKLAAVVATAALQATQRVNTLRRNEGKEAQEIAICEALEAAGYKHVARRKVSVLSDAPAPWEFCRESEIGTRKADIIVGMPDKRVMPIEAKVSNSATNSVKRLNNDAAAKATTWIHEFGTAQIVPSAVLGGVYSLTSLKRAQNSGLTLWWAHDLDRLIAWLRQTGAASGGSPRPSRTSSTTAGQSMTSPASEPSPRRQSSLGASAYQRAMRSTSSAGSLRASA